MKQSKVLALAGVTLLAAGFLAACSGSKPNTKSGSSNTFNYIYETDPENLNYLTSSKAATTDLTANVIDGLLENDQYGNLVPSMAEEWTVSPDGKTYTYKLRKDAKWYTSEGEEYADVTAEDFVTGLKYAADNKSETIYLVQDSVKGLKDYISGKIDFSEVGIKAVDDHTVEYTLNEPESFWNSKTTMGILYPVNKDFLENQGDKFAQATDPTSLLYNGPFLLKSLTSKSEIQFEKNPNYWDKENVHVDAVKLSFYDGQDQGKLADQFSQGALTTARLFPTSATYEKVEKDFKDNIVYTPQDASTFLVGTNIDRQSYNHTAKTSEAQKTSTKKALLNKDFRQALTFAFNRESYASQINGKDGADKLLRNLYIPPTFVQAGDKSFGDLVKEKVVTYGDEWKDVDFSDGQDGLYNENKAKAEFAKAKEALKADGVEFPIHLDIPVDQTATSKVQRVQSLKQSIEKTLGTDNVVIDVHQLSKDEVTNITLFAPSAAEEDWDISDNVGWSPDYQDPSTYLDILKSTSSDNTKTWFGFDSGSENAGAKAVGLDEYNKLVDEAGAETTDIAKRYEKYAAAQAWLTDSSLVLPTMASTGAGTFVSRIQPFSGAFAQTGSKGSSTYFKYIKVGNDTVTKKDYEAAKKKWQKEKAESNKKAQDELADHVK